MKHILSSLALVVAGALPTGAYAALVTVAQQSDGFATEIVDGSKLTFTNYQAEYSGQATASTALHVEYICDCPTEGGAEVVAAINNWICEKLDDKLHTHAGNLKDYIQTHAQEDLEGLREMAIESELDFESTFESSIAIAPEFENSDYVTLCCTDYKYWGGAHGMTYVDYVTFRKSDGKRMEWSLLQGVDEGTIVENIKTGLREYFEADDDEDLLDYLLIEADEFYNNFPLPKMAPYLTQDGVEVLYQLYEIAPYVAGTPMATVLPLAEFEAKQQGLRQKGKRR